MDAAGTPWVCGASEEPLTFVEQPSRGNSPVAVQCLRSPHFHTQIVFYVQILNGALDLITGEHLCDRLVCLQLGPRVGCSLGRKRSRNSIFPPFPRFPFPSSQE